MMVHPHVWIMGGEGRGCHGVNRGAQVWGVPHCTAHRCHPTPSSWFTLKLSSPSSPPSLSHSLPPMHLFSPDMHLFLPPCATHACEVCSGQAGAQWPPLPASPPPLPPPPSSHARSWQPDVQRSLQVCSAHTWSTQSNGLLMVPAPPSPLPGTAPPPSWPQPNMGPEYPGGNIRMGRRTSTRGWGTSRKVWGGERNLPGE